MICGRHGDRNFYFKELIIVCGAREEGESGRNNSVVDSRASVNTPLLPSLRRFQYRPSLGTSILLPVLQHRRETLLRFRRFYLPVADAPPDFQSKSAIIIAMPKKLSTPAKRPKIIVILGPTASGKSELAVKLAQKFNGEIISADSRQVYKGLNIGSGKVPNELANLSRINLVNPSRIFATLAKDSRDNISDSFAKQYIYKGIPHHLLDVASPKRTFTIAQYQKLAKKALQKILKKGKIPIICGGTGFYIDALIYDYRFPEVAPQPKLRKQLEKKSAEELFKQLKKLDPERAANIDPYNKRRLIRAIETTKTLGKIPGIKKALRYNFLKIGISIPKERLKNRIFRRVDKMVKLGFINETKKLLKKYSADLPAFDAIGYREIIDYLQGKISLPRVVPLIKKNTWQYTKRQMTWFKRDKEIIWVKNYQEAVILIKKFLSE